MTGCQGCGTELAPSLGRGRPRKWCSEGCRKRTLYGGTCVDCGAPTTADGYRHDHCQACNARIQGERASGERKARAALILPLRAEGLSNREIAERVGMSVPAVECFLSRERRRHGVDVARDPYMTSRLEVLRSAA